MPNTSTSSRPARRRTLVALVALALTGLLLALASPAGAGRAHFKTATVELVSDTGTATTLRTSSVTASTDPAALPDVLFTFTLVGAGTDGGDFRASIATATATYGCVNNGANRPKATNKTAVSAPLSDTQHLSSDERGQITGSILLDTGKLFPAGFSCPSGQTVTALQIDLDGITLTELISGETKTFAPLSAKLWP